MIFFCILGKKPKKRQVNYLHDEWRKLNFGPIHEPLVKLKEKSLQYDKFGKNVNIKIQNDSHKYS